jgi:hypothetical protein
MEGVVCPDHHPAARRALKSHSPFSLLNFAQGKEEGRLVDQDIKGGLADFIHG